MRAWVATKEATMMMMPAATTTQKQLQQAHRRPDGDDDDEGGEGGGGGVGSARGTGVEGNGSEERDPNEAKRPRIAAAGKE